MIQDKERSCSKNRGIGSISSDVSTLTCLVYKWRAFSERIPFIDQQVRRPCHSSKKDYSLRIWLLRTQRAAFPRHSPVNSKTLRAILSPANLAASSIFRFSFGFKGIERRRECSFESVEKLYGCSLNPFCRCHSPKTACSPAKNISAARKSESHMSEFSGKLWCQKAGGLP